MPSCPGLMVLWMFVPMTTNLMNTCSCTYCRCKSSRRSRGYSSKRTTWFRPTCLSGGMFLHCDTEKSRKDSAGRTPHTCCGFSLLLTPLCPRPGFLVCQWNRPRTSRGRRCTEQRTADASQPHGETWKPWLWQLRGKLSQFIKVRKLTVATETRLYRQPEAYIWSAPCELQLANGPWFWESNCLYYY